ncbi:3-hexulose-6-phosphate synthase [Methylomarinovum tepidoasis]|uniref:3-hexulose-6-phosphate synthase n=1 Tax=Methylomarinovum tepidoasis TaxID=2840183 RepID=A0AAU9CEH4_9GAMM|nr:3-hexulose-6-phosphate synthase [Methylomarinovum sp. IN45]BCX88613.1 3-hexulose-6-phosphate synthase [Methylomarinovum sp. IN45]
MAKKVMIQVALDTLDPQVTLDLAAKTAPYIDIIEIGTPCVKYNGISLVKEMKAKFPDRKVLADLKTMDAGEYEARPFFEAGADITTVLGVAELATVKGVIKAAHDNNGWAQVDMICVPDIVATAKAAAEAGADILGVHTGLDQQAAGQTPFADLGKLTALGLNVMISCAGGIKPETVADVVKAGADIVVVGGAIYGADDPAAAAKQMRELVDKAAAEV